jgi:3-methyl-2-oxobutanoate hydroxymethyltransferase
MSTQLPTDPAVKPVTLRTLAKRKADGGPRITMLTAYDATFARLIDDAGIDCILVGDSLGMVIKGEKQTLNVSIDEMAYHVAAVARGATRAHIIADLPFLTYHASVDAAVLHAGRLLQAGAHAVKLEGGKAMVPVVRRLVELGIPVMGHVGLLPQSVHALGGFVVQGKDEVSKARILDDAKALEAAGAYAIVLEGIPAGLAKTITTALRIPTIGIGAGNVCDGQVLVLYDLLGMNRVFTPRFVKKYVDGGQVMVDAFRAYADDVRSGAFPGDEHTYVEKS